MDALLKNKRFMKYSFYHSSLIGLRKIYSKYWGVDRKLQNESNPDVVSGIIRSKILSCGPLMITRFGAVALGSLTNHIGIKNKEREPLKFITGENPAWWVDEGSRYCMKNNAGFFPNDDESLYKFGERMLEDIQNIDVLASWLNDEWRFRPLFPNADIINFIALDPFWSQIPWTKALENKHVLVVHPFSEEIKYQYFTNRDKIHKNNDLLPCFELETVKAVQSIGGNSEFKSWFEALKCMEDEIDKHEYDVCLIGCGAYGLPLAAHVKRMGKQAIHMGGSLQLLFGIRGKRWETTEYGKDFFEDAVGKYPTLMNEHWIRPNTSSFFKGAEKVEGGCYW